LPSGRCLCAVTLLLNTIISSPIPAFAASSRRAAAPFRRHVVDIFAVDVLGFAGEGAAAVAATGVALLEPVKLEFGVDAVD